MPRRLTVPLPARGYACPSTGERGRPEPCTGVYCGWVSGRGAPSLFAAALERAGLPAGDAGE